MDALLFSIITEVAKRDIPCETVWDKDANTLGFSVPGFSKCGSVQLFAATDGVLVRQRYGQVHKIVDFNELTTIAWGWYLDYKHRSPFENPDAYWKDTFVEKGYLEEVTVTSTKYVIK